MYFPEQEGGTLHSLCHPLGEKVAEVFPFLTSKFYTYFSKELNDHRALKKYETRPKSSQPSVTKSVLKMEANSLITSKQRFCQVKFTQ